jgi:hypothetical protein
MKKRRNDHQGELEDIREILGVIIERMVAKGDFLSSQEETRQNFRAVRNDIAELRKETEFELDDLLGRVKYVEQKLGIESGK